VTDISASSTDADKSGETKYRIGHIRLLRQDKPTHRTDQDVVPTPRVGVKERSQVK